MHYLRPGSWHALHTAAAMLGLDEADVLTAVQSGRLKHVQSGDRMSLPAEAIVNIARQQSASDPPVRLTGEVRPVQPSGVAAGFARMKQQQQERRARQRARNHHGYR